MNETEKLPVEIRAVRPEDAESFLKRGMCIHGYSEYFCPWPKEQCHFGTLRSFMVFEGKVWKRSQQPSGSYWWVHESEGDDE